MRFTSIAKSLTLASMLSAISVGGFAQTVLDFRGVPSVPTDPAPTSGSIGDATYFWGSAQPAGSGTLDSFVRIKDTPSNVVEGYNTTVSNVYQNDGTNTFNHEISVGQVGFIGQVNYQGGYMQFVLDINQNSGGTGSLLSLDELQIFVSKTPNQSIEPVLANGALVPFANAAKVYQMDASNTGNAVWMDYDWFGGSGATDLTVNIARSAFDAAFAALGVSDPASQNGLYVYLYSRFGETYNNNDGYEEWAYKVGAGTEICVPSPENGNCGQQEIPEPGALPLVAVGLLGLGAVVRRRRQA
jgi:hypothetical protein